MNFSQLFRRKSVDYILRQVKTGESDVDHIALSKHLGVRDLTAFGIAAIIGAGVFSTIGNASFHGGPGVVLLSFSLPLPAALLLLLMQSLRPWFLFRGVRIPILMLPSVSWWPGLSGGP